jgi:hypothetical protein
MMQRYPFRLDFYLMQHVGRCAELLSISQTSMADVTFRFRNRVVPEPDTPQRCIPGIILIKSSLTLT